MTSTKTSTVTLWDFDRRKLPKPPPPIDKIRKKTVYLDILILIAKNPTGIGLTAISNYFKIDKRRLHGFLKTLENGGAVYCPFRSSYKPYILTKEGFELIQKLQSHGSIAQGTPTVTSKQDIQTMPRLVGVHNISLKARFEKWADIPLEKSVKLRGFEQKIGWIDETEVVVNGKSSVELRLRVKCKNPHEALNRAWDRGVHILAMFEEVYGARFRQPKLNRVPHFSHLWKGKPKPEQLPSAIVEDVGLIDHSEPEGIELFKEYDSKNLIEATRHIMHARIGIDALFDLVFKMSKAQSEQADALKQLASVLKPKPPPQDGQKPQEPEGRIYG